MDVLVDALTELASQAVSGVVVTFVICLVAIVGLAAALLFQVRKNRKG